MLDNKDYRDTILAMADDFEAAIPEWRMNAFNAEAAGNIIEAIDWLEAAFEMEHTVYHLRKAVSPGGSHYVKES